MKKVYNLFALFAMLFAFASISAQNTFFQETLGDGDGYWKDVESAFTKYDNAAAFAFDTIGIFIRNGVPSTNYADASGGNYFDMEGHFNWDGVTAKADTVLLKVNTSSMGNVQLHFGLFNNTGWTGIRYHAVTIEYSTNAMDWTTMGHTTTAQDTFPGSSYWGWVSLTDVLPSANNLYIMFINAGENPHEYYLDDITLTGISNDAKLSDLQVDGTTIEGFSANTTFYRYYIPEGSTDVPEVTATPNDPEATSEVTPAAEVPGTTSVMVTAPDGVTTWEYKVEFLYPIILGSEVILQETFGDGNIVATAASSYGSYSGTETWSDDLVTIRPSATPSNGYAEASGESSLAIGPFNSGSDTVTMMGINTAGYKNVHISFGFWNNTGWPGIRNHTFNMTYSTDGENWTTIDKNFTAPPTAFPANNVWAWVSLGEELPAAEDLQIHLWNPDVNHSWFIDDITITGDMLSSDATLSGIMINGTALDGFDAATMTYDVQIPGGALPTIEAEVANEFAAAEVSLPDMVPGTATITVTAEDGSSQEYTLNLEFATSVEQHAGFARIYPNPVVDVLRINAVKDMRSVEVLSVTGKVLLRSELNGAKEVNLNLSTLSKGLYIVRMTDTDAEIHVTRIVKR